MLLTCPLATCPETGQPLFVSTDVANSWTACTSTTSAAEVPAALTDLRIWRVHSKFANGHPPDLGFAK